MSKMDSQSRSKRWEENGLTAKQNQFVDNYIMFENATKAYRLAFGQFDDKSASVGASRLMKMDKIQGAIEERKGNIKNHQIATPEDMFMLLTKMMYDDELRASDRMKAIELLGKNQALWVDRVETTTDTNFTVNLVGMNADERKEIGSYIDAGVKFIDADIDHEDE